MASFFYYFSLVSVRIADSGAVFLLNSLESSTFAQLRNPRSLFHFALITAGAERYARDPLYWIAMRCFVFAHIKSETKSFMNQRSPVIESSSSSDYVPTTIESLAAAAAAARQTADPCLGQVRSDRAGGRRPELLAPLDAGIIFCR